MNKTPGVIVDNHSHILYADIKEMIASAKANSVTEFSITEHVSQFRQARESIKFGSVHSTGRIFQSLEEYREEFRKVDREALGMKIRCGLEVDFSPGYETRVGDFVKQEKWDTLLCSVHELSGGTDFEREYRNVVDTASASQLWNDYFRLEELALDSNFVPFDVLSHPVRMARVTKIVPPELDDLLLGLARAAKKRNKALELNGSDIDYAPGLVRRLATASSKAGCMVSLGSDAHYPREVFRNMRVAMDLVDSLKLKLWQTSYDR